MFFKINFIRQSLIYKIATIAFAFFISTEMFITSGDAAAHEEPYTGVKKIHEGFYVGQMVKQIQDSYVRRWLVMERVTSENLQPWLMYANTQCKAVYHTEEWEEKKLFNILRAGSEAFRDVLALGRDKLDLCAYEIWVDYISRAEGEPQPISSYDMSSYDNQAALGAVRGHSEGNAFARTLEMFVSVVSSPTALITSHMGIAATIENAKTRLKETSLDLHSFAAKVMIYRNPLRAKLGWMINTPVPLMRRIMYKNLGGAISFGTKGMVAPLQEAVKNLGEKTGAAAILGFDYSCGDELRSAKELLDFFMRRPPLLSVKNERDGISFTLYDKNHPDTPCFKVDNICDVLQGYAWLWTRPFLPQVGNGYIVLNLRDLAMFTSLSIH